LTSSEFSFFESPVLIIIGCYIGSTTQPLSKRLAIHRSNYKRYLKGSGTYTTSFKIFEECDDYRIELIEAVECKNKEELHKIEGKWIRETPNYVNKYISGRDRKERYQDNQQQIKEHYQENKIKILEKRKEHYQDNKIEILEKQKQPFVCECGSTIRLNDKARHFKTTKHQNYLNK